VQLRLSDDEKDVVFRILLHVVQVKLIAEKYVAVRDTTMY
jgi:hypothetical protein